ncbi:hypothetical protein VSP10_13765 [Myroides odoratimimus]|nr:hypothetical protein [Myroides odoratimimus]MEC4053849.1 hypothetical protein [Myroides odoratimimus]
MIKPLLIIGIPLLLLILAVNNLSTLMGGMSRKKANLLIQTYLDCEFKGQLKVTEIRRFFNAGNMNPNMFSVIVYDKNLEEIRWILYFDAKILKTENRIEQGVSYAQPIHIQYEKTLTDYYTKEAINKQMNIVKCNVIFEYYSLTTRFHYTPEATERKATIKKLLSLLNQQREKIDLSSAFTIINFLPNNKEDILEIAIHTKDGAWEIDSCTVNQKTNYFEILEKKAVPDRMSYLEKISHRYNSHDFSLLYIDTDSFTKGAWVHLLMDTKAVGQEQNGYHSTPITAVLIETINLTNQNVIQRDIIPITESKSFVSLIEDIKPQLGITYTF